MYKIGYLLADIVYCISVQLKLIEFSFKISL